MTNSTTRTHHRLTEKGDSSWELVTWDDGADDYEYDAVVLGAVDDPQSAAEDWLERTIVWDSDDSDVVITGRSLRHGSSDLGGPQLHTDDDVIELLTDDGHDEEAVLVYIDQMVDAGLEAPQPDEGHLFTSGEVEVLRLQLAGPGPDPDLEDRPVVVVTCDMAYDLHQVVRLPGDQGHEWDDRGAEDEARQRVIDHYGEIWASHVRRLAAERGYQAQTYWGGDDSVAHDRGTSTPIDSSFEELEAELFQGAHDAFGVSQVDVDRIAAEVSPRAATWRLRVWVDDEPNSRWEIVDSDTIDGRVDAAEVLENVLENMLDRHETPGEYRLTLHDADGIEIGAAESELESR